MVFGIIVSVVVHSLLVFLLPMPLPAASESKPKEELIEIELFPLDYGLLGYEAAALGVSDEEAALLAKLDSDTLTFAEQLPLGIFMRQPKSATKDEEQIEAEDLPDKRLPELIEKTLQNIAKSRRQTGRSGQDARKLWSAPPAKVQESVRIPDAARPEAARGPKDRPPVDVEAITGPVSARRIAFRPTLGEVSITTPGSVMIKFWVEPDGTVGRIIFEQKLDANLDDYSARYVRGLRFAALPQGKDYVEWGTITINFRVE